MSKQGVRVCYNLGIVGKWSKYNGKDCCVTRRFDALFKGTDEDRELRVKDYSVIVDCIYAALSN
jgi:hypothetical protein